jgi:NADPH-dependent 7-cyano-7-deazaguanine reductase QueF-like protein
MPTNNSSSSAFNLLNGTHSKKIVTLTTYSWDVKSTHDLIDSKYLKISLNNFN